ncbi:cell wall-binding repeat-containing protein [Agrococcus sp. SGAir0287]|uniref:cell wall-binding repeat-containing protein n=1 Tax=Agrococcus sp. SGAir0287 TaxID=2070347 RepID=UPI0010CD4AC5|nr:cell wall-binding repeat-containing protein [Agrococcus sp. SGAir0287]QCR18646.1 hypothetical protein C1N71_03595 [Agrococcus sp. SGAir0287]
MTSIHLDRTAPTRRRAGLRAGALASATSMAVLAGVLIGAPAATAARDTPDDVDGGVDVPAAELCAAFADFDAVVATTPTSVTLAGPDVGQTSVTYVVGAEVQTTTGAPVTFDVGPGRTAVRATIESPGGLDDVSFSVYPDGGRISGANRYETSVQVGIDTNYGACADTVFIANGESFPDALSSTPLVVVNPFAELLLSQRDSLPSTVREEIEYSGATNVVLLGGTAALSPGLCDQMPDQITSCTRISGPDRYATSQALAEALYAQQGGSTSTQAFIVSGERFPDAVSVAGIAAYLGIPVILVPGSAASLPPSIATWLSEHVTGGPIVVGGTASVSAGIEAQLQGIYGASDVYRISGANRYETSAAIAQQTAGFFSEAPYALLASGERFPDALTGGVLAGSSGMPLLLTAPTCLPAPIAASIDAIEPAGVLAIGGTAVVSDAALSQPC